MRSSELIWETDKWLRINDVRFFVTCDPKELRDVQSSDNQFLLGKSREMVGRSAAMARDKRIERVLDIGIFKGGSAVLYDQLFQPTKLVAVDVTAKPVDALDRYIETRSKRETLKPYYGVNQADRATMRRILMSEFPEQIIDLIVDDASHLYRETKESFNLAFPFLRAGGEYMIEDWAWAHWPGLPWQVNPWHVWKPRPLDGTAALSNLLIELFMLMASRPDFISNIYIDCALIVVTKGSGSVPRDDFDIGDHYLLRGKRFRPWL